MSRAAQALAAALAAAGRADVLETLRAAAALHLGADLDRDAFEAAFAAAGRRLGTAAAPGDAVVSDDAGSAWSIAAWGLDEIGRAVLLIEGSGSVPVATQVAWVDGLYRTGALRERQAILRALALLPAPERFLAVALDACRTSTQPVFEAIACENPYPATHFPEDSFNHLVLKAVFTGVPLARILGLARRLTPELARMADDYTKERAAAGRSIPDDLDMLMRGR